MSTITITIIAAILLMGLVVVCLAIGWILTGKSRLRRGTCGGLPQKGKKTTPCSICGAEKVCDDTEKDQREGTRKTETDA